ncbi:MerR family transcriptional regulator [Alkalicoccobacillus murimartini]|uniref:DNA-binding transcriptional MerR regulator n=1 Tax=Alkalicoccobacillus murimartini TaxID=171685 RepID=A0ABT9YNC6_9BACI|nr:MerR family transcriptional regulator [Alkalicoccobacillus murimartini]MDQ0208707.1 DNA-binding transcriptional MerR regulator [Alkalicoccobacillus murimartini]
MNIKTVSENTGVSADTIRYYERIGLIPAVKRNKNGVRVFDEEDIRWIEFSRQMRNAGLSIEALIEYISLFKDSDDSTIPARVDILTNEHEELQKRMNTMQSALERLKYKINNYESHMVPREKGLRDFDDK